MKPTGTIRDIVPGTKIKFIPACLVEKRDYPADKQHLALTVGTICYVNYEKRMFRAEYECNGHKFGQSFKF